jgi:hypothetical protein
MSRDFCRICPANLSCKPISWSADPACRTNGPRSPQKPRGSRPSQLNFQDLEVFPVPSLKRFFPDAAYLYHSSRAVTTQLRSFGSKNLPHYAFFSYPLRTIPQNLLPSGKMPLIGLGRRGVRGGLTKTGLYKNLDNFFHCILTCTQIVHLGLAGYL